MYDPRRPGAATGKRLAAIALTAGALGASAIVAWARGRRAERRHPPVGRFLVVDGVRLHYVERGRGNPMVLLHGNGGTLDEMLSSGLVDRLARRHRVVVFDRPGFGYSERPRGRLWTPAAQAALIRRALARLGIEEAVVYGHSLGAQVGAELALEAPDLVRGLVLGAGYLYPTARLDVALVLPAALPVLGDLLRYTLGPPLSRLLLPRLYAKIFAPLPVPDRFLRAFPHALVLRPWHLRAAAEDTAFLIPAAAALRKRYASLRMPVVIVAGEGDRIVRFAPHARRLHRNLPGSRLVVVPGAGHMIHHEACETVAEAIESLAAEVFERGAEPIALGNALDGSPEARHWTRCPSKGAASQPRSEGKDRNTSVPAPDTPTVAP